MIELSETEQRFFDENTSRKQIVMEGSPDAHTVWLDVGVQHFEIGPVRVNVEEANWMRSMLAKALDTITADALEQCHRELARTANAIDDIYRASAEGRDLICKYYGHWHPQFVAELPEYKLREPAGDRESK